MLIDYNSGGYDYFRQTVPYRFAARIKFDGSTYIPNNPFVDPIVHPKLASEIEKGTITKEDLLKWVGSESRFQIGRTRGFYRRAGAASAEVVKIPLFKALKTSIFGVLGYCTRDLTDVRRWMSVGVDDKTNGVGIDTSLFMLSAFPGWRVHDQEIIQQLFPPLPTYPNDTIVGQALKLFAPETVVAKGSIVYLYIKNDISAPDPEFPFDPDNTTGSSPITEGDITFEFYAANYSTEQYPEKDPGGVYEGQDTTFQHDYGPFLPLF